ncbi:hypothetical protein, partial [Lachnotalea glycerini]|uniref:hypothetical protein n=1 Tax=Lachnotalea glycerini TaxID=1763509 RepID=UPI001A9A4AFF
LTVAGTAETVAGGIGDIFGAVISMSGAGAAAGIPTIAISTDVLITGIAEMAYGISISMTATDNLAGDIKKAQEAAENTDVSKGGSEASLDTGKWNKGSFESPEKSLRKHFNKHGAEVGAKDPQQYLRKAEEFARNLKGARKAYDIPGETPNITRYYKNGKYIDLAPDGTIISFGKQ